MHSKLLNLNLLSPRIRLYWCEILLNIVHVKKVTGKKFYARVIN